MRIEWSEPAVHDLQDIRNHIARESKYYASQFVDKAVQSIEKLVEYPKLGREVPEIGDKTIREIIFQNYRFIYKLESNRILVLSVIHGSRDLSRKENKPWEII